MNHTFVPRPAVAESTPPLLLVGHPAPLATALASALGLAGFGTEMVATWEKAGQSAEAALCLIYVDGTLAGFERVALIAEEWAGGLIAVLAEDSEAGRVACLDRGADDVLGPDVPPGELAARVRAVLRRVRTTAPPPVVQPPEQVTIDTAYRCLIGPQGERTALSEAEHIALETLLDADGAPVSREWLGRVALKRPLHSEDRSVDQLVLKLRRKLAAAGVPERTILSSRRQGYVIPDPSRFRSIGPMPQPADARRSLVPAGG